MVSVIEALSAAHGIVEGRTWPPRCQWPCKGNRADHLYPHHALVLRVCAAFPYSEVSTSVARRSVSCWESRDFLFADRLHIPLACVHECTGFRPAPPPTLSAALASIVVRASRGACGAKKTPAGASGVSRGGCGPKGDFGTARRAQQQVTPPSHALTSGRL